MIIFSAMITLCLTAALGYVSKFKTKTSEDFISAGGEMNTFTGTGALMGAIIGGASTVGTAQLAFSRGVAALWFILGLCTASILLSYLYRDVIVHRDYATIPQILEKAFGPKARILSSLLLTFGMLIHINGQVIACNALFNTVFGWQGMLVTGIVIILLVSYVIFGGFWGSAIIGSLKMILLYSTSLVAGYFLIVRYQGLAVITTTLKEDFWFNPFNDNLLSDVGSYVATVVGVLSTQNYFQSIIASKNLKVARQSGYLTAFLVFPVGVVCTLIGMFMRAHHPDIAPATAFPQFIVLYLPDAIAGITLATILISSLATGAGLTLGVSTIFAKDLYVSCFKPEATDAQQIRFMRLIILSISIITFSITTMFADTVILDFGFASMLFRAGPIFVPVVMALFFPSLVQRNLGVYAILVGPLASILWIIGGMPMQSAIFIGLFMATLVFIFGRKGFKSSH